MIRLAEAPRASNIAGELDGEWNWREELRERARTVRDLALDYLRAHGNEAPKSDVVTAVQRSGSGWTKQQVIMDLKLCETYVKPTYRARFDPDPVAKRRHKDSCHECMLAIHPHLLEP